MNLYIVRHAIALEREDWPERDEVRPLTAEGEEKALRFFKRLFKKENVHPDAIWASPAVRALQTAHLAGTVLGLPVWAVSALGPGARLAGVQAWGENSGGFPETLMLVGHEPDCGKLIGELAGDPQGDHKLKKAGVALLQGSLKSGKMSLIWSVQPG